MQKLIILSLLALAAFSMNGNSKNQDFEPEQNPIDQMVLDSIMEKISQQNLDLTYSGVTSCKKQVVSGLNYYLTLEFEQADGRKASYDIELYVVPWEKKTEMKKFERKEESGDLKMAEFEPKQNPIDEMVFEKIMQRINQQNIDLTFNGVLSCKKQVVAGLKYYLTLEFVTRSDRKIVYDIEMYVRPWENKTEIEKFTEVKNEVEIEKSLDGGFKKFDWNNQSNDIATEETKTVISKVLIAELLNRDLHTNFEVTEAYIQVVSGINMKVVFNIGDKKYVAFVFTQPWTNTHKVTSFIELTEKKQQKGGFEFFDWNAETNDEMKSMMKEKVSEILVRELSSRNLPTDFQVVKASQQLVSGINFKVIFKVTEQKFESMIYYQPWTQTEKVVYFKQY